MSFTLHLGENGVYTKHDGEPLMPCQEVLLADGVFTLPRHFEEDRGQILIARSWHVPAHQGHYLVIEFLPLDLGRWPW